MKEDDLASAPASYGPPKRRKIATPNLEDPFAEIFCFLNKQDNKDHWIVSSCI